MRRELPMAISTIAGVIMIVDYFFKIKIVSSWAGELQNWGIIISAFALGLAAVGLFRTHGKRVMERKPDWFNSLLLLGGMVITVYFGIFHPMGRKSAGFNFIFNNIQTPLGSILYAMAVFYLSSAAYRAFRARSVEAAVLLVAGVIVMLGRAPIGEYIWSKFPVLTDWLIAVPNLAGVRGIMIGAAVGIVVVGIRILLGIDRSYMGKDV